MVHFSPSTFDFHQLRISLINHGQTVRLQGRAENCDLNLIKGKDLRYFIEYKRYVCAAIELKESKSGTESVIPKEVEGILSEYADVFKAQDALPPNRSIDHEITLKPGQAQTISLSPLSKRGNIEKSYRDVKEGIVIHITNPFASSVLLVKRK